MKAVTETIQKAVKISKNKELLEDIQAELERMRQMLLHMDIPCAPMQSDLERIIASGGKRLRPVLAYLCYRMGSDDRYPIQPLMCMLELMHTASLIHDDVVDNAVLRRGCATINATSGVDAAVQSGDFLLAEAMGYLHFYKGTGINEALVQASTEMCLGELRQLIARYESDYQTREEYFFQIYRKTASLIAASCFTGAVAGGLPESKANMLRVYGEKLGVAFQLCDDLLDFSEKQEFGKKPGQDLQNGIFTLPVLYLLEEEVPAAVKTRFRAKDKDDGDIRWLIDYVRASKALDYTKMVIRQKTAEAVDALRDFPQSKEKAALKELAVRLSGRHV
ncbi:heptaprenyl diphosphate synthase [Sporobacter termitidis DSM 10068]|uniref:Heptaprenyl diphosphate synthase n=1 Tax=Sporobacter termitidis DSM 10068 TaxID=1123282 RepID=A0A1M5XVT6_9FIRM|nr:polyprenyl synthetase family protein [Sporobacter termitidis]SHI03819.1 heptaprenyl diphosphate synthase [Sporobacter termitidis DSM 10068]